MKVYIKELAWKVPVCVAWIQCTPWINDGSLTYWDQLIICFSFILSLDLIRWGLRKDKGPDVKEDQQPSTGNTVVPRLQDINVDKLVSEYHDSLLPHVNALCHKSILNIATWSYRQGIEEMIEMQKSPQYVATGSQPKSGEDEEASSSSKRSEGAASLHGSRT